MWDDFHRQHEARFGFAIPGETIETVNLKVVAVAVAHKPSLTASRAATDPPQAVARRRVRYADGWHEVPVYTRATLCHGHILTGAAVIEEDASVTVLGPANRLSVDRYGNLHIAC